MDSVAASEPSPLGEQPRLEGVGVLEAESFEELGAERRKVGPRRASDRGRARPRPRRCRPGARAAPGRRRAIRRGLSPLRISARHQRRAPQRVVGLGEQERRKLGCASGAVRRARGTPSTAQLFRLRNRCPSSPSVESRGRPSIWMNRPAAARRPTSRRSTLFTTGRRGLGRSPSVRSPPFSVKRGTDPDPTSATRIRAPLSRRQITRRGGGRRRRPRPERERAAARGVRGRAHARGRCRRRAAVPSPSRSSRPGRPRPPGRAAPSRPT